MAGVVVALAAFVGVLVPDVLVMPAAWVDPVPLVVDAGCPDPACVRRRPRPWPERSMVEEVFAAIEAVELCEPEGLTPATARPASTSTTTTAVSSTQVPRPRGRRRRWARYLLYGGSSTARDDSDSYGDRQRHRFCLAAVADGVELGQPPLEVPSFSVVVDESSARPNASRASAVRPRRSSSSARVECR